MFEVRSETRALEMGRETQARLTERRDDLAGLLRFYDPAGDRCEETIEDVIRELSGHVLRAAAIALDGGFKPISRILPDIQCLEGDPRLLMTEREHFDGEAVGEIAAQYQRCDEPAGTWWMDVTEGGADPEQVKQAANRALAELDASKPGKRRPNMALAYMTIALRAVYLRYNDQIARSVRFDKKGHPDTGRFCNFVDLVAQHWFGLMGELRYPGNSSTLARYAVDDEWIRQNAARIANLRDLDCVSTI